jgi:hypothetical protein
MECYGRGKRKMHPQNSMHLSRHENGLERVGREPKTRWERRSLKTEKYCPTKLLFLPFLLYFELQI